MYFLLRYSNLMNLSFYFHCYWQVSILLTISTHSSEPVLWHIDEYQWHISEARDGAELAPPAECNVRPGAAPH